MIKKRKKELIRLVSKYRQGKASLQEITFLENYYEYLGKEAKISLDLSDSQKESLRHKIFSNIQAECQAIPQSPVYPLYKRVYFRAAVAAIFLLLSGATIYLYKYKENGRAHKIAQVPIKQSKNDVPPGGNKALLTLADGRTIVLDSAANGFLAQQGNTHIIKLNDGRIIYNSATAHKGSTLYNTISTPKGGQYEVVLPDNTRVWLNSVSSLKFPTVFTGINRRVELTGEGYFEVYHDVSHPFTVMVNKMEVNVLGTKFNVMGYADEEYVKTTLVQGRVRVNSGPGNGMIIWPGQQARFNLNKDDVARFEIIRNPDLEEVLSWKNGEFRFNEMGIKTIMRQIERWYNVEVEYKGELPDVHLSGVIPKKEYVSQLLGSLETAGKVHFVIEGRKIIVTQQ